MKEDRYFKYNKKGHTAYDYSRKEKIIAISKGVNQNNDS